MGHATISTILSRTSPDGHEMFSTINWMHRIYQQFGPSRSDPLYKVQPPLGVANSIGFSSTTYGEANCGVVSADKGLFPIRRSF